MRCRTVPPFPALVLAALALAAFAPPTQAADIATFQLVNTGTTPITQVDLNVVPPGTIVPPVVGTNPDGSDQTASPLTITTGSQGFDKNNLVVLLGNGPGVQDLRLLFGQKETTGPDGKTQFQPVLGANGLPSGELEPGGVLNFSVTLSPTFQGNLHLSLPLTSKGLNIVQYAIDNPGSTAVIPEPLSLVLWSSLAGLSLLHARAYRRSRNILA
jgi:hypothetical protein